MENLRKPLRGPRLSLVKAESGLSQVLTEAQTESLLLAQKPNSAIVHQLSSFADELDKHIAQLLAS